MLPPALASEAQYVPKSLCLAASLVSPLGTLHCLRISARNLQRDSRAPPVLICSLDIRTGGKQDARGSLLADAERKEGHDPARGTRNALRDKADQYRPRRP